MSNCKLILAIDIGTSSVKCSAVSVSVKTATTQTTTNDNDDDDRDHHQYHLETLFDCTQPYDDNVLVTDDASLVHQGYSQMDVRIIYRTIVTVIQKVLSQNDSSLEASLSTSPLLNRLDGIAVCGQMHGVVLWNIDQIMANDRQNHGSNINKDSDNNIDWLPLESEINWNTISNLYDWRDARCDAEFLRTHLPTPCCYADQISSGFGCATLFWLKHNEPEYLSRFNQAGTIMDWFVTLLCSGDDDRTTQQMMISAHNAHSWGYFDPHHSGVVRSGDWNRQLLLDAGFPIHLLPKVVPLDYVVGNVQSNGNNKRIPVFVAHGDLQSMMYLALQDQFDSMAQHQQHRSALILNMGTSAQLGRLMPASFVPPQKSTSSLQSIDYVPFVPDNDDKINNYRYLGVALGLNGGNVLHKFVNFILQTVKLFYQNDTSEVTEEHVWNLLDQQYTTRISDTRPSCRIVATLFGERHQPQAALSLNEIRFNFPTVFEIAQQLCVSLVDNIFNMAGIYDTELHQAGATISSSFEVIATGSVLMRNRMMRHTLENKIGHQKGDNKLKYIDEMDAQLGVALYVGKCLLRKQR